MSELQAGEKKSTAVDTESPGWRGLMKSRYDRLMLAAVLCLTPLLVSQMQILWSQPDFQFFPLSWIACVLFIYFRGVLGTTANPIRERWAIGFGGAGLLCAAIAAFLFSPWLSHLALACFCSAWVLMRLGGVTWYHAIAWSLLIWFTLPLPMDIGGRLMFNLQSLAGQSASSLLDLAGTEHLPSGNIIELRVGKLFVDEACHGISSIYSLATMALLLTIWLRTGLLVGLVTLLTVPAWTWFGNVLSIFTIALMLDTYEMGFAHGWKHTVLGLGSFAFSACCMLLMQKGLQRLFEPFPVKTVTSGPWHTAFNRLVCWPARDPTRSQVGRRKAQSKQQLLVVAGSEQSSTLARRWNLGLGLVFAVLGVTSAYGLVRESLATGAASRTRFLSEEVASVFQQEDLPQSLGEMQMVAFEIVHRPNSKLFYGEHSVTWQYVDGENVVHISLDFPFRGFHVLERCYVGTGCEITKPRESIDHSDYVSSRGQQTVLVEEVILSDQLYGESYLCYAEFDREGVDVWRPGNRLSGGLLTRIARSLKVQPTAFQVQLYVDGVGRLTKKQRTRYQQILLDACDHLLSEIQQL